ncbi:unnamed protein product [Macrosiphum euphorbiae]|uniref:Uncharacterized protein n=1 Tax=Macrosiphum euphorbiae TaxID=13131 RepID=A0AAV0VHH2_9HEMI|nr:unnamed protein product [Macrosiphum euphorbiae]
MIAIESERGRGLAPGGAADRKAPGTTSTTTTGRRETEQPTTARRTLHTNHRRRRKERDSRPTGYQTGPRNPERDLQTGRQQSLVEKSTKANCVP